MTDAVYGIRALPLYQLIGAPLVAMIRADAEAARATLEFIETVGFETSEEQGGGTGEGTETARLRMATFRYKKLDQNNEVAEFEASIPILSLVPVPSVQIKEGRVSFSAKISDIVQEEDDSKPAIAAGEAILPKDRLLKYLPNRAELITKPVASSGAKDAEIRGSYDLEIEVSIGQADVPLGMEQIFALMDQAIRNEATP